MKEEFIIEKISYHVKVNERICYSVGYNYVVIFGNYQQSYLF